MCYLFKRLFFCFPFWLLSIALKDTVSQYSYLKHPWLEQKHINFLFFVHFQELEDVFSLWPQLLHMELRGNPVCKKAKYRDRLIVACRSLGKIFIIFLS